MRKKVSLVTSVTVTGSSSFLPSLRAIMSAFARGEVAWPGPCGAGEEGGGGGGGGVRGGPLRAGAAVALVEGGGGVSGETEGEEKCKCTYEPFAPRTLATSSAF
jgi:hypothetical protein